MNRKIYNYRKSPWYLSQRVEAMFWLFLLGFSIVFTAYMAGVAGCEGGR